VGVEPELQRRGIALEVAERLRREGNHTITVDLDPSKNERDFYEKMGFKPLDSNSMIYKPGY